MNVQDVAKEIKKLNTQKATQSTDIPVKILKEMQIFLEAISGIFSTIV